MRARDRLLEHFTSLRRRRILSVLIGTLAFGAAWLLVTVATAPAGHSEEAVVRFSIPAQPLSSALLLLGYQARISVAAPQGLVAGKVSPAIQGKMPLRVALAKLLAPFGLRFEFVSPDSVRILPAAGSSSRALPARPAGHSLSSSAR